MCVCVEGSVFRDSPPLQTHQLSDVLESFSASSNSMMA